MADKSTLRKAVIELLKDSTKKTSALVDDIACIVDGLREQAGVFDRDGDELFLAILLSGHRVLKWAKAEAQEAAMVVLRRAAETHLRLFDFIAKVCGQTRKKWFSLYEDILEILSMHCIETAFSLCFSHIKACIGLDINTVLISNEWKRLQKLHEKGLEPSAVKKEHIEALLIVIGRIIRTDSGGHEVRQRLMGMCMEMCQGLEYFSGKGGHLDALCAGLAALSKENKAELFCKKTLGLLAKTLHTEIEKVAEESEKTSILIRTSLSGCLGAQIGVNCLFFFPPVIKAAFLSHLKKVEVPWQVLVPLSRIVCPSLGLFESNLEDCFQHVTRKRVSSLLALKQSPHAPHLIVIKNKAPLLQRQDVSSIVLLSSVSSDLKIVLTRTIAKISQLCALSKQKPTKCTIHILTIFLEVLCREYPFRYTPQIEAALSSLLFVLEKILHMEVDAFVMTEFCKRTARLFTFFSRETSAAQLEKAVLLLDKARKKNIRIEYELLVLCRRMPEDAQTQGARITKDSITEMLEKLPWTPAKRFLKAMDGCTPSLALPVWNRKELLSLMEKEFASCEAALPAFAEKALEQITPSPSTHEKENTPCNPQIKAKIGSAVRTLREYIDGERDAPEWLYEELKTLALDIKKRIKR
eukprot:GHVN01067858.1.p1 GENE.GHVN01067858.1~~GHVN01067858.1.p1  ORF type:complete len:639 (+),score=52.21 GHVN01067858.1:1696-3612(+)